MAHPCGKLTESGDDEGPPGTSEAARWAAELSRDQRELDRLLWEARHDRAELYRDSYRRGYDPR